MDPEIINPVPRAYNPESCFVKGQWYNVTILGGVHAFWVRRKLDRAELRPIALEFMGPDIYTLDDIESVRKQRKAQ